ncbi:MAG: gamma-glutamyl-gamma-aminobutyrate hydrolase family protein [Acidobacteriota bacterium]|nr:gamma-glutamyl-gamma-aminobutyrate hydrolase family protein [Acidobacteriota bacterium]
MGRALVLRHHPEDRAGLVGEALAARGFDLEVVMMDEASPTPTVEGMDLLVILGSKHAVYDPVIEEAWFGRELEVVAEADRRGVPIFGICFGAQALCRHFGGTVAASPHPEVGWFEVEEVGGSGVPSGPWFEWHFDACTLPEGAELWATNPRAVQAFAIGRHVGVQFHPEIDEGQLADWLSAGGDDDARALGLDPADLLARTSRETPVARARVAALVELVLRHTGAAAGTPRR